MPDAVPFLQALLETVCKAHLLSGVTKSPNGYLCIQDLILQHGKVYTHGAIPSKYHLPHVSQACFHNCYRASIRNNSPWIYVEGFAIPEIPFSLEAHHAWLTRADQPDVAFDPTWDAAFENTTGRAYIGIPISREYLKKMFALTKEYSVFDTPLVRFPVLRGVDKIEDIIWKPEERKRAY